MTIQLPENVQWIIRRIAEAGFEAYAVGGCVRDSILGKKPDDWDITTSAAPMQIKAIFPRTIDTGIRHGTVTVMVGKEGYEVTTYRLDGEYEDARHPKEVTFTSCLEEDLKRRDFTMNAMAYSDSTGIVDLFGGMEDMEHKVIRCVGTARERFTEDALRMMRAIRFSAQLGYHIEEKTQAAIKELAGNLKKISAERIQAELTKLVISDHPENLRIAYETGVLEIILPEFKAAMETEQKHPHHFLSVGEHTLLAMGQVPPVKELRLAVLLHDIGKPKCLTVDSEGITHFYGHAGIGAVMAEDILKRLRYDNHTIETVARLVKYHDYGNGEDPEAGRVRRAINKIGEDIFPLLFYVKRADIMAQREEFRADKLARLEAWKQSYEKILKNKECVSLKTLAITGQDLIGLGMKPGKEIGEKLNGLLELVLEHPEYNDKDTLKKIALAGLAE